jgi:peroxiredoxin
MKYFAFLLIFMMPFYSNAQIVKSKRPIKIFVKLNGLIEGDVYKLTNLSSLFKESCVVNNGQLAFNYSGEPDGLILAPMDDSLVTANSLSVVFWTDSSNISITNSSANLSIPIVQGSLLNERIDVFKNKIEPLQEIQNHANASGNLKKADSVLKVKRMTYLQEITNFKNSHYGMIILYFATLHELFTNQENTDLYNQFSEFLKSTLYGRMTGTHLSQSSKLSIGEPAPNFEQSNTTGNKISLKSLLGKYVLLNFWASWCAPCRFQNPALVEIYKNYGGKQFEILGVSLDGNKKEWTEAIVRDSISWIHISDLRRQRNQVAMLYNVRAIPSNYLIDERGIIIKKNISIDDLKRFLSISGIQK